jgi:Lrp/AsnC family transcriptional regulator for asnA, asnC and gidA
VDCARGDQGGDSPAPIAVGVTSTTSAPTTCSSVASARQAHNSSAELIPPGSGVPVPGAKAGSSTSGRRSYVDIGKAVGLSEAATRQRVNRLRESGAMRIVAIVDPIQLGRGVVATMGVRASGDTRLVAARLAEVPEIEYVVLTAGSFDLIAELVCETEEELLRVINESVRAIDEVRETETFMYPRTEKNVFAWGRNLPGQAS